MRLFHIKVIVSATRKSEAVMSFVVMSASEETAVDRIKIEQPALFLLDPFSVEVEEAESGIVFLGSTLQRKEA